LTEILVIKSIFNSLKC